MKVADLSLRLTMVSMLLVLSWPAVAMAHVLKTDNGVTVELHIPPADTPKSGEHTTLEFEFSNIANNFMLHQYRPQVNVLKGADSVAQEQIRPVSNTTGNAEIVFPDAGTYHLVVTGNPAQSYPNFSVEYQVTVAAGVKADASKTTGTMPLVAVGAAFGCIVAITIIRLLISKRHLKSR